MPWLLARGAFGTITMMTSYYAVKHLPIGEAIVLIFISPIFTGILSRVFLKEPWGWFEAGASVMSLARVVCIARPDFIFGCLTSHVHNLHLNSTNITGTVASKHANGNDIFAVCAALLAALSASFALVVARKLGRSGKVHFLIATMYYGIIGAPVTFILTATLTSFTMPASTKEGFYLVTVGLFRFAAQALGNKGLALERALVCSLVRNIDIVFAFAFQVFIFNEQVTVWSGIGTVLIIGATLTVTLKRYQEERRKTGRT